MDYGYKFAIIDQDGVVVEVADSYIGALERASKLMPLAKIWYDGSDDLIEDTAAPMPMAANAKRSLPVVGREAEEEDEEPVDVFKDPEMALKVLRLDPIPYKEVMKMSLTEAHRRLVDMFPTQRLHKSTRGLDECVTKIGAYRTPKDMAESFFGQNYKLAGGPRPGLPPSATTGLSLLPAQSWRLDTEDQDVKKTIRRAPDYGIKRANDIDARFAGYKKTTTCFAATTECKKACLVFSGQNFNDRYNTIKKYALMQTYFSIWPSTPRNGAMTVSAQNRVPSLARSQTSPCQTCPELIVCHILAQKPSDCWPELINWWLCPSSSSRL
jgi:hypothetical protein